MKKNIGTIDKILRALIGVAVILLGILYSSWWGLLGLIPLFTVFIGWCPLYTPFNISTKKND